MVVAVPLVEFLADALAILLYVVAWVVAIGLLWTWDATFHKLFAFLEDKLKFRISVGFRHVTVNLGGWLGDLDDLARNELSAWALGSEIMVGKLLHALGWIFGSMTREIAAVSQDVLSLGHWIVHTWAPAYVHGITSLTHATTKVVSHVVHVTETKVIHTTKVIEAKVAAGVHAVARPAPIPWPTHWDWINQHWKALEHAVTAPLSGAVAIPGGIVHELPVPFGTTLRGLRKRLGRVEALLGATAMAVAIANVLGIPSWRCLTKGPIGRVSRALCGLDSSLLAALLAGIVVLETPLSLEEFARELLDIETDLANLVFAGFSELDGVRL